MHPEDVEKTTFTVENGHYEFCRMPFGVKNAPSTFHKAMEKNTSCPLIKFDEICVVYMDDISIFATSLQEHILNIE